MDWILRYIKTYLYRTTHYSIANGRRHLNHTTHYSIAKGRVILTVLRTTALQLIVGILTLLRTFVRVPCIHIRLTDAFACKSVASAGAKVQLALLSRHDLQNTQLLRPIALLSGSWSSYTTFHETELGKN